MISTIKNYNCSLIFRILKNAAFESMYLCKMRLNTVHVSIYVLKHVLVLNSTEMGMNEIVEDLISGLE